MAPSEYTLVSNMDLLIFGVIVFGCFLILVTVFYFGWRMTRSQNCPCPYTGLPLRFGSDLPYWTKEQILRYLNDLRSYDNRMFDLNKAAYCRDTGRVFPDAVGWFDTIHVDWNFLRKRYPGNYVSWGSLTEDQQRDIKESHATLAGFQTEESSRNPLPKAVEPDNAYSKPGPLYVDITTKVLMGWKEVPGTEFEVLIVQKPVKKRTFNIPKELSES